MTGRSVKTSKAIHRRTGKTFYVATRLLPERVREATYALYAFFRIADDVVDRPDPPDDDTQRQHLEAIRAGAKGDTPPSDVLTETDREVLETFRTLATEADIDPEEIDVFIDAMAQDIDHSRYDTYEELRGYMRGSAAAVGNMMLSVMDPPESEAAKPHARSLAEAFQLTNFVRDVREDICEYDRVYLPAETLDQYGVTEPQLRTGEMSQDVAAVIRTELHRTESLYRHGVAGIRYLPEDCQFAVLLSAVLYADHHRQIRQLDYDVLGGDASLTMTRRLWLVVRTWYHWRRTRDPEAAFYAASAISEDGPASNRPEPQLRPDHVL
ncbi:Phytoene/squalene synthetase [Halorhabdus sp. SVX81]|uniref:phytoene/squalene synthase family protein n=1 Tax=Halorhabdus sp. SVX81 TaxID=2978283 RepID=UPI0023DA967B|nr:phytoene/squalene synthase family protein [Halorhabdus sp. SVX81]WEL17631.1 Phytoene/squalene synthetase [Halorhabdus sp. SVX81]